LLAEAEASRPVPRGDGREVRQRAAQHRVGTPSGR
jgi:hypothetical protein